MYDTSIKIKNNANIVFVHSAIPTTLLNTPHRVGARKFSTNLGVNYEF
jgi:hypothetical protein